MTPRTLALSGLLAVLLPASSFAQAPHDLMPAPARLEWGTGALTLGPRVTVAASGVEDPRIDRALDRLAPRLAAASGARVARTRGDATLVVAATGAGQPVQSVEEDESYELVVTPRQARLTAPGPLGVLRGMETFLQLVRRDRGRAVVPAVTISDRPRFPWRGLLIDPCRRWEPVEIVKRTLDTMAAVKMNVLHWHLSEDQGFRVESRVFPKLHQQGSDGLFYTQEQVKDVIAYARDRGIRVVPEFDVPGHSTSWLVGHPELGSVPGPFELVRTWGIYDNNLDPTRDEVYAFLDRFLGEMAALFPDAYLHIGGDEVTPRQWNGNARILDYMYRNRLGDAHALQAHFNARLNEIVRRHGKRMVGWDEILAPELPKDTLVHSWRGSKSLAEAAAQGHQGILSNGYYLDHMLSAATHYLVDPIPPGSALGNDARARILGGEACMWGEFVDPGVIESRLWPRAAAIAERLWSPADVRDVEDMYRRLDVQSARLEALGSTHRSGYEPMLAAMIPGHPVAPFKVLADVVEPVKIYRRGQLRAFRQDTPLDRLPDAARPESLAARVFGRDVNRLLATPAASRDTAALRGALAAWRDNHAVLEPILDASPRAAEARPLSRDLAAVADIGLQALDTLAAGTRRDAAWLASAQAMLAAAYRPRAEVQIAIVPAVCRLAYAAGGEAPPEPCPPAASAGH